jgi:pimeloyl-ACP methyl ester carboxylesterase
MTAIIVLVIMVAVFLALMLHANVFTRQVESKYPPLGTFVGIEGLKLHYVEKGSGQSVILLHGDGGTTYDFTLSPLFDQLAKKYHVLAFDRPGLGYSERPTREGWSPISCKPDSFTRLSNS